MTQPTITRKIGEVQKIFSFGTDKTLSDDAGKSTNIPTRDTNHMKDRIRFVLRQEHDSIFEHAGLHLDVTAPLFVTRQWLRHRMSSTTEQSGRYTILKNLYIPEYISEETEVEMIKSANSSYHIYTSLIEKGNKNEVARMILPVNIMTTFVWTVNLRSLFNFLHQRLDEHAQYEIRYLAGEVEKIFAESFPITYKYWEEFRK